MPYLTDPLYLADIGTANKQKETTLANLGTQRTLAATDYGYNPTYDEHGLVKSLAVDPNNPYSKAALLTKSYQDNLRRNQGSFASRGQLYAGSLGVAQSLEDQNFSQGSNSLTNAFIRFIATNQGQINQANTDWTGAIARAEGEGAYRASQAEPAPAPAPSGGGAAPTPAASPTASPGNATPIVQSYLASHPGGKVQQKGNTIYGMSSSGKWYIIGYV